MCFLLCICAMGQSDLLRVLVASAQAIHVVSQFHIYWPPLPMYALRALAIFNFSLEMLPWTCYGIPMRWCVCVCVCVCVCLCVCVCVYAWVGVGGRIMCVGVDLMLFVRAHCMCA